MPSTLSSNDHLVASHWQHEEPCYPASSRGPFRHQTGHRSSGRPPSVTQRQRMLTRSRIGMRSSLEHVTGIVSSTEYRYSLAPLISWNDSTGNTNDRAVYRLHPSRHTEYTPELKPLSGEGSPKRNHWADLDDGDAGPPTPPMTPQIGRLKTPELGPVKERSRFCGCCQYEERHGEGREKMDFQRRLLLLHSFCGR